MLFVDKSIIFADKKKAKRYFIFHSDKETGREKNAFIKRERNYKVSKKDLVKEKKE